MFIPQADSNAFVIAIPAIIKAVPNTDGRRLVEVEASVEQTDLEGDLILQSALLNAAPEFIKSGHLDLDHLSEIGGRMGIPSPESYIVGKPIEVKDIGEKRTSVICEIFRAPDGVNNPKLNRYDALYESIQNGVIWKSSIYGFPIPEEVEDCRDKACESGATRYVIKALEWRSLAFTRNPVCAGIKHHAKVLTIKSYAAELIKSGYFTTARSYSRALNSPSYPSTPGIGPDGVNEQHPPAYVALTDAGSPPATPNAMHTPPQGPTNQPPSPYPPEQPSMASVGPFVADSREDGNLGNIAVAPPLAPGNQATTAPRFPQPRIIAEAMGHGGHLKRECPFTAGLNSTPGFREHFKNCCGMAEDVADLWAHALMHAMTLERRRVA